VDAAKILCIYFALLFLFNLMVFYGKFESLNVWSLYIIQLLLPEFLHLLYRTGHQREWPLCWAK